MDCRTCHGVDTMQRKLTNLFLEHTTEPVLVENIPGYVCVQCADTVYPWGQKFDLLVAQIQTGEAQASRMQTVPVYDYQEFAKQQLIAESAEIRRLRAKAELRRSSQPEPAAPE